MSTPTDPPDIDIDNPDIVTSDDSAPSEEMGQGAEPGDGTAAPTPITAARSKRGTGTRPARGYTREPFSEGNTASQTHGARSPRAVSALAQQYAEQAVAVAPHLGMPQFVWSLDAWANAEARRTLINDYLDDVALLNNRNTPRHALLERLSAAERAAERGRQELGLSPAAAISIAVGLRAAGASMLSPADQARLIPGLVRRGLTR